MGWAHSTHPHLQGSKQILTSIWGQHSYILTKWWEENRQMGPLLNQHHVQDSRWSPPDLGTTVIFVRSDKPAVMIASTGTCRICVGLYSQPSEYYSHPAERYSYPSEQLIFSTGPLWSIIWVAFLKCSHSDRTPLLYKIQHKAGHWLQMRYELVFLLSGWHLIWGRWKWEHCSTLNLTL